MRTLLATITLGLFANTFNYGGYSIGQNFMSFLGIYDKRIHANCYAYALGHDNKRMWPGKNRYIVPKYLIKRDDCIIDPQYLKKILESEGLVPIENPEDYSDKHLVMAFICPDEDYHFYRKKPQDAYWTHKFPGSIDIYDVDGNWKKIVDPRKSNRNFILHEYTEYCGCFVYEKKM